MTSEITPAYVKALFHHLVKAVGGVDAAGAYLGVSFQRVSMLQKATTPDMPTIMQVHTLERVAERSVVFDVLANAIGDNREVDDLAKETREATYAAVDLQRAVDTGARKRDLRIVHQRLMEEAEQVRAAIEQLED